MIQYIVAYEDDNMESPVSVYDTEKSLGDIFTFNDRSYNFNISVSLVVF